MSSNTAAVSLALARDLERQAEKFRIGALKEYAEGESGEVIKIAASALYFGNSEAVQALWDILRLTMPDDVIEVLQNDSDSLRVLGGFGDE